MEKEIKWPGENKPFDIWSWIIYWHAFSHFLLGIFSKGIILRYDGCRVYKIFIYNSVTFLYCKTQTQFWQCRNEQNAFNILQWGKLYRNYHTKLHALVVIIVALYFSLSFGAFPLRKKDIGFLEWLFYLISLNKTLKKTRLDIAN